MPLVYLDTSMYNFIDEKRFPEEDVKAFGAAVSRHAITVYLSCANIEELLGQWDTSASAVVKKLRMVRDLVGFENIVKQPADLMTDDIRAYAYGTRPTTPLLPRKQRKSIAAVLHRIVSGDRRLDRSVSQVVAEIRQTKEAFVSLLEQTRDLALAKLNWNSRDAHERRSITFEELWQVGATPWADALAERAGAVEACRARGLAGVLELRTVRVCVGVALLLVFYQAVGEQGEPRQPRRSDGYDLWHAGMASAAEIFATSDERLAKIAERVPVEGFRVVRSIGEIIAAL